MLFLAFAESIQLFPDGTIFVHIAMILVMIWILNRTFFRPINKVIESREKAKGGHGTEAEQILSDVAAKDAKFSKAMLAARSEGYELIEKERNSAVDKRTQAIAAAKAETSNSLAEQRSRLAAEAETARAEVAAEAEVMADRISSSILRS